MGKWGVGAAAMGVGGTGAAGAYGAHSMGLFGGSGSTGKQVVALAGQITGTRASYSDQCLKDIFQEATVDDSVPSLDTNFT